MTLWLRKQEPAVKVGISKEDSTKRAVEDYSQSNQHLRAALQYVFAANGGAAVAMLTCLTSLSTADRVNKAISIEHVLFSFGCASGFYLLGTITSVLAFCLHSFSRGSWGHFWEDNATTGEIDFDKQFAKDGDAFGRFGDFVLFTSMASFVLGSIFAVSAFLF